MLVKISDKSLQLSNIDKVFWPNQKITKGNLLQYYLDMGAYLIPHIKNRPMVLKRYPNGIAEKSFYQKKCPKFAPSWINKIIIKNKEMLLINDLSSLIWIINLGCIELHPWLAKKDNLTNPDIVVFDLDPEPPADFKDSLQVALLIKEFLSYFNLESFPKTSGNGGLHIYIPIKPTFDFKIIKETMKNICVFLAVEFQEIITVDFKKEKRRGKIYLDYLQNGFGKTMASVYSVRPVDGAYVSAPLLWEEIVEGIDYKYINIEEIKDRIQKKGEIFAHLFDYKQDFRPLITKFGNKSFC